ncbi:MAG: transglutaminase domain-containing protein [Luteolibacter sp.]
MNIRAISFFVVCLLGGSIFTQGEKLPDEVLRKAGDNGKELQSYFDEAVDVGTSGERFDAGRASRFLVRWMPEADLKTITKERLHENLELALKAVEEFPWGKTFDEEIFVNDVLPYAVFDETRENWRAEFYEICSGLVEGCETASEAAQVLNRELFDELGFHYNTGRKKPNQSPSESQASGKATCTGLSIALVYGCRSVGIPARAAGIPLWSDLSGNHTWVEIWDGEWKFLGADEYDAKGLNRGWFLGRASKANPDEAKHSIWASSWSRMDGHFPMVWNLHNKEVGAVNETYRYIKNEGEERGVGLRVFMNRGEPRVVANVSLLGSKGELLSSTKTKAGRSDLNDVGYLELKGEAPWLLKVEANGVYKMVHLEAKPTQVLDVILNEKDDEGFDLKELVIKWEAKGRDEREKELEKKVIRMGDKEMKFLERKYGEEPEGGHSLWISMHGGGSAPPKVNDQQWRNQINLYQLKEGYYVAPRAPTDTWNMWHEGHIDAFFDRLISDYVILRGVNPERVYLMGYSAGGDGVYQLAPRMADRFAAASMMAGHPNETKPDGLRNLPFEIFMGAEDGAYNRNKKAANWKVRLGDLQKADPGGYKHRVTIYEGLGHGMRGKEAEVIPRMAAEIRNSWPSKIVWLQDDTTHERFYWLGVQKDGAVKRRRLEAVVDGQNIFVTGEDVSGLKFWLSDELLDLGKEVTVSVNGKEAFRGMVPRSAEVVMQTLDARCGMVATALLEME